MAFIQHCFIRKNTTEIKNKLKEQGSYIHYYNDYEEIRHYTGKYEDMGFWEYLDNGVTISIDNGVTISIENVPEKYLDMTYDSKPRTI